MCHTGVGQGTCPIPEGSVLLSSQLLFMENMEKKRGFHISQDC